MLASVFRGLPSDPAECRKIQPILSVVKRYNLLAREKKIIDKAVYMPVLLWYNEVALKMEGKQNYEKLEETILTSARILLQNKYKACRIIEILDKLFVSIPSEIAAIRSRLIELQNIKGTF